MTVPIPPNDPSVAFQYIEFQEGDGDNVLLTLKQLPNGRIYIDEDGKSRYIVRDVSQPRKGMTVVKCERLVE
jgi:hypothetical protein